MSEELAAQLQSVFPDEADQLPIYLGNTHGAVLAALRQDLRAGRRFICLVGPAGSGKTKLLQALRAEFEQGMVGMAMASRDDAFLFSLMKGLGLQVPDRNEIAARQRLAVVLGMAERKHTPVLQIVDVAERLGRDDLGTLFQLFGPSFTQVVLSGRPELLDLLADGQRPLGIPRPDAVHRLEGLGATETGAYISHRLRHAQLPEDLFASEASAAMHARSGGVPRLINAISREALRQAEATGEDRVGQAEVQGTAKAELPPELRPKAPAIASATPGASQMEQARVASRPPELPPAASEPPASRPAQQTAASEQAAGSPPRKSSAPTQVPQPSGLRDRASKAAEPTNQQDAPESARNSERPAAAPEVPPSDAAKSPSESAMRATRQVPTQQPGSNAQAQPQNPQTQNPRTQTPRTSEQPARAERSEPAQARVKAPSKVPVQASTPPPQPAKTSPPRQIPTTSESRPASLGRGTQRPPHESVQPPRRQAGAGAAARPVAVAVAQWTGAGRNYLRPTLIAVAIMAAVALGLSGYRGADEPSPTVAERFAGPDAGDGVAQVNGPERPAEPPTASAAGAQGASGADATPSSTPPSAMTTAPAETAPGETPADAAVDFAQLSSNDAPPAQNPANPDQDGSGARDAPRETGDTVQAPEPGRAVREPAEPAPAVAEVGPPASSPPLALAQASGAGAPGPGSASAAPEAASPANPAPKHRAATATKPKAASAARRPTPSAAEAPSTPTPAELARLYAVRADYELNRGKPREALISVAHGLAAVPDDRKLRQLRTRALEQLRVRTAQ